MFSSLSCIGISCDVFHYIHTYASCISFMTEYCTSMLGRVAALLIRDLGKSRVIFLALARGQELVVSIFIS
jgi:hypothetical protein